MAEAAPLLPVAEAAPLLPVAEAAPLSPVAEEPLPSGLARSKTHLIARSIRSGNRISASIVIFAEAIFVSSECRASVPDCVTIAYRLVAG